MEFNVVAIITMIIGVIVLGAFLPTMTDNLTLSNTTRSLTASDFPIIQKAVLQGNTSNNTGFIVMFLTSPISSRTVDTSTLCFVSSQTLLASTFFNVSAITNQTWTSALNNEEQNRTGFTRTVSKNVAPTAVAAGTVCIDVTSQIAAQAANTYGTIEVLNGNETFDYSKVSATYSGASQDVWITNSSTTAYLNRTVASSISLTAKVSKPVGDALIAVAALVVVSMVVVVILKMFVFT